MGTLKDAVERALKAFNNGDLDGYFAAFADDAVYVSPDGRVEGVEAIRASLAGYLQAMPDMQIDTVRQVEEGAVVMGEYVGRGTFTGPLSMPDGTQIPPTGNATAIPMAWCARFENDKVVAATEYYDSAAFFAQLGLTPPS